MGGWTWSTPSWTASASPTPAGIFACVLGVEMLLVDSAVVVPIDGSGPARTMTAPDWAPWTLLSIGAATILHFGNLHLKPSAAPIGRGTVGHF